MNKNINVNEGFIEKKKEKLFRIQVDQVTPSIVSKIDDLLKNSTAVKKRQKTKSEWLIETGLLDVIISASEKYGISHKDAVDIIRSEGVEINGKHVYPNIIYRNIYEAKNLLRKRNKKEQK